MVEDVQRSFTRRLPGFNGVEYAQRLEPIGLQSLEHRRLLADLLLCYKIIHSRVARNFDDFFAFSPDSVDLCIYSSTGPDRVRFDNVKREVTSREIDDEQNEELKCGSVQGRIYHGANGAAAPGPHQFHKIRGPTTRTTKLTCLVLLIFL